MAGTKGSHGAYHALYTLYGGVFYSGNTANPVLTLYSQAIQPEVWYLTGQELSGNGYSPQQVTFGPIQSGSGNRRKIVNTSPVLFGPATADWPPIVCVGLHINSSGYPYALLGYSNVSPSKTVYAGDYAFFPVGSIVFEDD